MDGRKPYMVSLKDIRALSRTMVGLSLKTNIPTMPAITVTPPIIRKNVVQLPASVMALKPTRTTIRATTGKIDKTVSTKPRFVMLVMSEIHAENAASLATDPKKVIKQSIITKMLTISQILSNSGEKALLPKMAKAAVMAPQIT